MVGNLRKNRHIVALQIESDEAELKQLKKQEEGLLIRLRPIQARLKENEKMAEKLREHIAMAVQKFDGVRIQPHTCSVVFLMRLYSSSFKEPAQVSRKLKLPMPDSCGEMLGPSSLRSGATALIEGQR